MSCVLSFKPELKIGCATELITDALSGNPLGDDPAIQVMKVLDTIGCGIAYMKQNGLQVMEVLKQPILAGGPQVASDDDLKQKAELAKAAIAPGADAQGRVDPENFKTLMLFLTALLTKFIH